VVYELALTPSTAVPASVVAGGPLAIMVLLGLLTLRPHFVRARPYSRQSGMKLQTDVAHGDNQQSKGSPA
jgi:hypothetical protein